MNGDYHFTEDAFRALIHSLKSSGYRFASFGEYCEDRHVLWRHDVDFSMHRAVALAEIEAEEGVRANYFVNPRCIYYNLAEAEIVGKVQRIRDLGHKVGLHFDGAAHAIFKWSLETLAPVLKAELLLLHAMTGIQAESVSWHNPDYSNLLDFADDCVGGVMNAYALRYREGYAYCSDSNGYWRFTPMPEVIAAGHKKLHLLTHPELWTPEALTPSARIDRAIEGRARATRATHDKLARPLSNPA